MMKATVKYSKCLFCKEHLTSENLSSFHIIIIYYNSRLIICLYSHNTKLADLEAEAGMFQSKTMMVWVSTTAFITVQ